MKELRRLLQQARRELRSSMRIGSGLLDLRAPSRLGLTSDERRSLAKFARRRLAETFASEHGYYHSDVHRARTHIEEFWVVGRKGIGENGVLLRRDGSLQNLIWPPTVE